MIKCLCRHLTMSVCVSVSVSVSKCFSLHLPLSVTAVYPSLFLSFCLSEGQAASLFPSTTFANLFDREQYWFCAVKDKQGLESSTVTSVKQMWLGSSGQLSQMINVLEFQISQAFVCLQQPEVSVEAFVFCSVPRQHFFFFFAISWPTKTFLVRKWQPCV